MKVRRAPMYTNVSLVSLGDIAFLLITFFVLSTNFVKNVRVELDPATAVDVKSIKEPPLTVQVDKDGVIWCGGEKVTVDQLQSMIETASGNVEERVVMLSVDREIKNDVYGPVMLAISRAGMEIALAGQPQK